jgi:organic radical activating enzyme
MGMFKRPFWPLNKKDKKPYLFFEWKITEKCNVGCSYCVNSVGAEASPKTPGNTIKVAEKLLALSKDVERLTINLTGGEPTIAPYIRECLLILTKARNIDLRLITNLRAVSHIEDLFPAFSSISVSLHLAYRSDEEVNRIIRTINQHKARVCFYPTQVDYQINEDIQATLMKIKKETGLIMTLQPFITPWAYHNTQRMPPEATKAASPATTPQHEKPTPTAGKISSSDTPKTAGKRCCLGYFTFLINPDASLQYDLWCNDRTRKIGDFLLLQPEEFILNDMKKCPDLTCGCNYNYFSHKEYLRECARKGYPKKEIFISSAMQKLERM